MRLILVTTVSISSYLFIICANPCFRSSFLELSLILVPHGDYVLLTEEDRVSSRDVFSDQWQKMMERRAGSSQADAALGERGLEHFAKSVYSPGFTARSDSGFYTPVPVSLLSPRPAHCPSVEGHAITDLGPGVLGSHSRAFSE